MAQRQWIRKPVCVWGEEAKEEEEEEERLELCVC